MSLTNKKVVDLCYELEDLARFDSQQYANDLFTDEYAGEAYEENLENCVNMATSDASEVLEGLIESSEKNIKSLLDLLIEYEDSMLEFIDN